jgi:hypothetical protein
MSGGADDRRERWLREVLRTGRLGCQTKLVLVVLYKHMRANLRVSVSRSTIAGELGWGDHLRRVSGHLAAARSTGFLVTVIEGSYGRTATWQGVIPERTTDQENRAVDESVTLPGMRTLTDDLADRLRVRKTSTLTDARKGQG